MPTHSIDYLNARRDRLPASGGTNYAKRDRILNVAARKLADAEMDATDMLHEQVRLVFADFRAWFAESTNALRSGDLTDGGEYVPF
jgi:hypothetical protein